MQFNFDIGRMISLDSEGFAKIDQIILGNNSDYKIVGNTHYVNSQ